MSLQKTRPSLGLYKSLEFWLKKNFRIFLTLGNLAIGFQFLSHNLGLHCQARKAIAEWSLGFESIQIL